MAPGSSITANCIGEEFKPISPRGGQEKGSSNGNALLTVLSSLCLSIEDSVPELSATEPSASCRISTSSQSEGSRCKAQFGKIALRLALLACCLMGLYLLCVCHPIIKRHHIASRLNVNMLLNLLVVEESLEDGSMR